MHFGWNIDKMFNAQERTELKTLKLKKKHYITHSVVNLKVTLLFRKQCSKNKTKFCISGSQLSSMTEPQK